MYIKQFRSHRVRVADPFRPGKKTFEDRLIPAGATSISHEGKTISSDSDGWFEVDAELGKRLLAIHNPGGERFHTPEDVDERVRLGEIQDEDEKDEVFAKDRSRQEKAQPSTKTKFVPKHR